MCRKSKTTFELKNIAESIFKPKRQVPFVAGGIVKKELDCLEKIGVQSKTGYSASASPTIYIKRER